MCFLYAHLVSVHLIYNTEIMTGKRKRNEFLFKKNHKFSPVKRQNEIETGEVGRTIMSTIRLDKVKVIS